MKHKTAKKYISKKVYLEINENWIEDKNQIYNDQTLDSIRRTNINLRVPFRFKGSDSHITISAEIEFKKSGNGYLASVHCNFLKPLTYAVLIFGGTTITLLQTNINVVFALMAPLLFSFLFYFIFREAILRRSIEFLDSLCDKYQ